MEGIQPLQEVAGGEVSTPVVALPDGHTVNMENKRIRMELPTHPTNQSKLAPLFLPLAQRKEQLKEKASKKAQDLLTEPDGSPVAETTATGKGAKRKRVDKKQAARDNVENLRAATLVQGGGGSAAELGAGANICLRGPEALEQGACPLEPQNLLEGATPEKRKRGRPRKSAPGPANDVRLQEGQTGSRKKRVPVLSKGDALGVEKQAEQITQENEMQAGRENAEPFVTKAVPLQDEPVKQRIIRVSKDSDMQQAETQPPSDRTHVQVQDLAVKSAPAPGAQQAVTKVPDIFLTANERKRRLQEAKKEEQRLQEEAAAASERARLEKAAEKLRVREERKKEAEERKLKAKEEKAKAAEERKLKVKAAAGGEGELKAREEKGVVGVKLEEEKGRGSPKGKKRGRPRKVKLEGAQKEASAQGAEEGNVGEVVLLSGSEKEEAQTGPSLLEKMEKRQKEFRESIRESQEAHAKLHAGKATHPFFKRKQGPPADDAPPAVIEPTQAKESKLSLAPLDPLHVTQEREEESLPVTWQELQLRAMEPSTSARCVNAPTSFHLLEPSILHCNGSWRFGKEAPPTLGERQESALLALFDYVQARSQIEVAGESSDAVRELRSLEALRQRFDWYKSRAAQLRLEDGAPESSTPDLGGEQAVNALWCNKYRPLSSQEVCGNLEGVHFIRDWLSEWTDKIAREQQKKLLTAQKPNPPKPGKKWQASDESSEWLVSWGGSDSDLRDEEDGLSNVLLLSGPTGAGKTATVYALAKELGYQILESNPSEKRSRATILQRFGEATESKGLMKWSLKAGRTQQEGKAGAAKVGIARLLGQATGANGHRVRKPRSPALKRSARKRPKAIGGPELSGSEISGFRGSESSGSFVGVKKGRKGRKKGLKQVVKVARREGFKRGVDSQELGTDGKGGESVDPKRLSQRRKTVGFVGVEKSSPDLESEQQGGEVAVAATAPPNEEGGVREETSGGFGERKEGGGEGKQGMSLEEQNSKESRQEILKGEEPMSSENGTEPEGGAFPPVYQRKRRGDARQNGRETVVGTAPLVGKASCGTLETSDDLKKTGEQKEALGLVPDVKPDGKEGPVKGGADGVTDSGVIVTPPRGEMAASPLPTNGKKFRSETSKSADSGREMDGISDGPRGLKRKPNGGVRKRVDGKESGDDSPPAKRRRSFGRPAVLSKVRTRPCSPVEKQGSGGVDPRGPVLNGVAVSGGAKERAKRKGAAGSEVSKANGGLVKENGSRKGHVAGAANPEGVGERAGKRVSGSCKALLLFEEIDQQFEEDKGFMSAIATLAASTKRPMILTCNDSIEIPSGCDFRKLFVNFAAPPALDLTIHACLVAASEGTPVNPWVVERLVRVTKGDTRKVLLQVQLWSQQPTSAALQPTSAALLAEPSSGEPSKPPSTEASAGLQAELLPWKPPSTEGDASTGVRAEPPSGKTHKPHFTETAADMHVEPLSGLPSETPLTAADLGGEALPKRPFEPPSNARDASAAVQAEALVREPPKGSSAVREALQEDALPGELSRAKDMSGVRHTEPRSVAGLTLAEEQLGDPSPLPSVAVNPPADRQAASLPEAESLTSAGVLENVLEQGKAAGTGSLIWKEGRLTKGGLLKKRDFSREGAQDRAWLLWPSEAVRELHLDAAHRSLPALADVALPCQLAAAVATWQKRKTLREERAVEWEAEREAARVYGVLEEEECTAARVRKALQEAKAAVKAAEKAELAEKRRLAREARRRGVNGAGVNAPCVDELDDLEDMPIGSLAVSAGLGTGQPEDASPVVVRRRLRGRRRAIEEDDDVSDPGADVITAPEAPGGEAPQVDGRPKSGEGSLLDQACSVCGGMGGEESMLLCDEGGCQGALHTYCSEPPIEEVPEGDWFCAECTASRKAVGGVKRFDGKEGVERPGLEGAEQLEQAREPLAQSAEEAVRQQGPDCGQPEGKSVDELERVKELPEEAFCKQSAEDGQKGLQKGAGQDWRGGVNELERVEGLLVQSVEEALYPQGAGRGQSQEEGLQKDGQGSEAGFDEIERVKASNVGSAEETFRQQGLKGGPQNEARNLGGGVPELERLKVSPVQDGNNGQGGVQEVKDWGGQDLDGACVAEEGGTPRGKVDVSKIEYAPNGEGVEDLGPSQAGSSPLEGSDSGARFGELQTQEPVTTALQSFGALKLDLEEAQFEARGTTRSSAPPLEEVAELPIEELRALVSGASRQAVAISAAVWGLTDDLSASELMALPRGSESVANAAPGCEECDDVVGRVSRQAAACLAYTSLRWRLDTCQFGRTAGERRVESTDWETEAELETATGTATGSGVLGGIVGGSPGVRASKNRLEPAANGTQTLPGSSVIGGMEVDARVRVVARWTECEWALGGPGRLLAAAGDEAALSGFLAAGGGEADQGWLQLQLSTTTEQRGVERRAVDTGVKEVLHGQASARHCAGLLGRVARADYAGFLGQMYTLEAKRQRDEEGLRRADRAYRAHLSDLELPDHVIEILMQSTRYHVRADQ